MIRALLTRSAALLGCAAFVFAQSSVIFETGFERWEGYDPEKALADHAGWLGEGTGGNGLGEFIPGLGQQAYIGLHPPVGEEEFTSVWRPVIFNPVPPDVTVARFSVVLQLVESTAGGDDDFRWSVYNREANFLFSIDFETRSGIVSYILQDRRFYNTGYTFDFEGTYDLVIWMDFARNQWTALLNDVVIANSQPIRQDNSPLNLGDVDAVWFIRNPTGVGNNFMIFDNYRITAEREVVIPAVIQDPHVNSEGFFTFTAHGQRGVKYSVDVTSDFREWFSLVEFVNTDGTFTFEDTTSTEYDLGFYRLRVVQ